MASRGKYLIVLGELEWFYTLIEEHPPPKNWFSEIEWKVLVFEPFDESVVKESFSFSQGRKIPLLVKSFEVEV